MIDPISAFAAIQTAATAISSAVKAGRDLSSLAGPISKYAQAEADLAHGASTKKKSIFAKLGAVEQTAIEKHFRQEEVTRLRDQMRELFQLYGSPGQWERLQATIAEERARRKRELAMAQHRRDQMITIATVVGTLSIGVIGFVWWVRFLMEGI
jgi:hypothetical protein